MPESAIRHPLSREQLARDLRGLRHVCAERGPARDGCGPLVITIGGARVGEPHFTNSNSRFYGTPYTREGRGS
jgi:hypothetical protein